MNLPIQAKPVYRQGAGMAAPSGGVTPSDYSTCVGASVGPNGVCFKLPVIGNKCIPIKVPVGASVRACGKVCTHWGIPTGIGAYVTVNGNRVWSQNVGWC